MIWDFGLRIWDLFYPIRNPKSAIQNQIMASTSRATIRRGIHSRIRKKVSGTAARPRLAVFRSLNHIYAQIIDDEAGKTLVSASSIEADLKGNSGGDIEAAKRIGKVIGERAQTAGISEVVYDRGGYLYHGRVKALIDASREAGLNKRDTDAETKEDSQEESNEG